MSYDALVIAAHPDDAEAQMGGVLAKLSARGQRILLVDLSAGEPADFGVPVERSKQAAEAAAILGVERVCLGMQDRLIVDSQSARVEVARLSRELFRLRRVVGALVIVALGAVSGVFVLLGQDDAPFAGTVGDACPTRAEREIAIEGQRAGGFRVGPVRLVMPAAYRPFQHSPDGRMRVKALLEIPYSVGSVATVRGWRHEDANVAVAFLYGASDGTTGHPIVVSVGTPKYGNATAGFPGEMIFPSPGCYQVEVTLDGQPYGPFGFYLGANSTN